MWQRIVGLFDRKIIGNATALEIFIGFKLNETAICRPYGGCGTRDVRTFYWDVASRGWGTRDLRTFYWDVAPAGLKVRILS